MNSWWRDIRYSLRSLAKNPAFTVAVVITLALAIGVNSAVFSLLDAILLRPLPFPDADRLVSIYHRSGRGTGYLSSLSYPNYEYYRDHNQVFSDLTAFARLPIIGRLGDQIERLSAELVTSNYFSALGVGASVGRTFRQAEAAAPVVVLGYDFWKTRLGADPAVIGNTINIHGHAFTILGIASPGFRGVVLDWGDPPQLWIPIEMHRQAVPALSYRMDPLTTRGMDWLVVVGRLKKDTTFNQAQASMAVLNDRLKKDHPEVNAEWGVAVFPTNEARFWPGYRSSIMNQLGALMAVAGLVLLIACLNVANLILARGLSRQRETAVRLALGASRIRLVRQLLTESCLLALLGCAGGLFIAEWTARLLLLFPAPFGVRLSIDAGLDLRVFLFSVLISTVAAALCGLLPARQGTRLQLATALKLPVPEARLAGFGLRNFLVVIQVAMAVVVLIASGLFIRTLQEARSANVIPDPDQVLVTRLELLTRAYSEDEARLFYSSLLERLKSLPGVQSAVLALTAPLIGRRSARAVIFPSSAGRRELEVNANVVSPGYFHTLGLSLVRGRDFSLRDDGSAPPVAIVNEEMARQFWPGEDPIGKRFLLAEGRPTVEVIGLVRDGGKMRSVKDDSRPCFYLPLEQEFHHWLYVMVRVAGDRLTLSSAMQQSILDLDDSLPPPEIKTMQQHLDSSLSRERMTALLLGTLGLLATILSSVGVYGVVAFSVQRRTREIAIRMAVGARSADILRWAIRKGVLLFAAGLLIGSGGALVLTRFVQSLLYGVTPNDPMTFILVSLFLGVLTFIACYIPARRAASVDPMVVLRYE